MFDEYKKVFVQLSIELLDIMEDCIKQTNKQKIKNKKMKRKHIILSKNINFNL